MTQPKALYLADILEDAGKPADIAESAAAELRRLHAENQRCRDVCAATAEGWRVERDALLEALKNIDKEFRKNGRQHWPEAVKARAAIAKVEANA